MGGIKRVEKKTKIKRKQNKYQQIAPSEQVISHGEMPPPLPPTEKQIEHRKRLQGAILMASQEFLRLNQDAILVRAIEILKEQEQN